MKYINKILLLVTVITVVFAGCRKVDDLPIYEDGSSVTLSASSSAIAPALADSNKPVVEFSWSDPKYASNEATFKYIVEIDSAGRNFSNKVTMEVIGDRKKAITGRELNNILLNYGFALGTPYKLNVRVISSYGNNNEKYTSNTLTVTVTPFNDPSVFATSATTVTGTLATAADNALTFSWSPSFQGYSGAVTYSIQFDTLGVNFASPHEVAAGVSLYSKPFTKGEINQMALDENVKGGSRGRLAFRLKAVTAQGAVSYSNPVLVTINSFVSIINMYLVGSLNGWDINAPLQMIADKGPGRSNKVYYSYVMLNAGDAFKFVKTVGDWGSAYGNAGVSGAGYTTGYNQGGDFSVTSTGVYRLTIDIGGNLAYVQQKQVGIVGNMQAWNPAAPIFGGYVSRDKFLIVANSSGTDNFKFHEGPVWDNGTPDKARWWGKGALPGTLDNDGQGGDITANSTPRTRAIWDGTDPQQVKYELSPAIEMRIVGNGIQGVADWTPSVSPTMTYQGNGVWKKTLTLVGGKEIKFLAGNDWGAFDYEDNGDNGTAGSSIKRKLKYDGGSNFSTPTTTGTYTITLNEHTQSVTIAP